MVTRFCVVDLGNASKSSSSVCVACVTKSESDFVFFASSSHEIKNAERIWMSGG
jgi:hypothetical protein